MKEFNYWKELHDSDKLDEFSNDNIGQLWLKLKSIIRKELIAKFIKINSLSLTEVKLSEQFLELFNLLKVDILNSHKLLDDFIQEENRKQIDSIDTEKLVSELYKVKNFDWGGDYQNSLDKFLINRFVKVHKSYDKIISILDNEISIAVKGYVMNSWYNHWSSILIENIFKSHSNVLPTVGKIKNVDFFLNNIPFDLKVTYLPSEFIKIKRKEKGYPLELTYLKRKAKQANIEYDAKAKSSDITYEIIEKMKDRNNDFCNNVLNTLKNENQEILNDVLRNSKILAKWLYENQGEMRFGSENRLFLVLIDTLDYSSSWKLKRNIDLLKPVIDSYLNDFSYKNTDDLRINFNYKGKPQTFTAMTDVIFAIK